MIPLKHNSMPVALILSNSSHTLIFFKNLFKERYHIVECNAEEMLLEILASAQIDLIFVDEKSLYFSSHQLCQQIRKISGYANIPLLIITNQLKKAYTNKLKQAGASGFILDPLEEEEVKEKLKEFESELTVKEKTKELVSKISYLSKAPKNPIKGHQAIKEESKKISILVLEIDQYKQIKHTLNDLEFKGFHKDFEKILFSELRSQDSIKESDAGKYVIILPNTSKTASKLIAENIKETIMSSCYSTSHGEIKITVSIGIVTEDSDVFDELNPNKAFDRLIKVARNRLNLAKRKGNKIINS